MGSLIINGLSPESVRAYLKSGVRTDSLLQTNFEKEIAEHIDGKTLGPASYILHTPRCSGARSTIHETSSLSSICALCGVAIRSHLGSL
jgi:hypothetical protein